MNWGSSLFHKKACLITFLCCASAAAAAGPDVIVGDLPAVQKFTSTPINGKHAYSVATTSCNIGDQRLDWQETTPLHPVIGQNLYRLKGGRFEQVGMSWLKHGFFALSGSLCSPCNDPTNGTELGVGCSDPYDTSLNGGQGDLGPRSDVNAATGVFPYPYTIAFNQTGNNIFKRLQVEDFDVDISTNGNGSAIYFVEGQYVTQDDAAFGNAWNNASYRRVTVNSGRNISVAGTTQRQMPAIQAWRDHGLGVNTPDPNVTLVSVDVVGDGRIWFGAKVTDLGGGMWHYEYAVQNLNSDRSGGSFSVPRATGVTISNVGFHDVFYHSGDPYDNTDWNNSIGASAVTWTPAPFAPVKNSNALRWGTLYNFRFDANSAPTTGMVTLGFFKTVVGQDPSVSVSLPIPSALAPTCSCSGDVDGGSTVDADDIAPFVAQYMGVQAPNSCADMALPNGGALDGADLTAFMNQLLTGSTSCP